MSAMFNISKDDIVKGNAPAASSSTSQNMWSPPKEINMYKRDPSSKKRKIAFSTAHLADVKPAATFSVSSSEIILPPTRDVFFDIPDLCKPGISQEVAVNGLIGNSGLIDKKCDFVQSLCYLEDKKTTAAAPTVQKENSKIPKNTPSEENLFYKPSSSRKRKITFSTAHLWEKKPCVVSSTSSSEVILPPKRDIILDIPDMWKSAPRQEAAKEIPRIPTGKIQKKFPLKKPENQWIKKNEWSPKKSYSYRHGRRY